MREAHRLRALLNEKIYLRRLFNLTLREIFYRDCDAESAGEPGAAGRRAAARFEREFQAMLLDMYGSDHAFPRLIELLKPGGSASELAARLRARIAAAGAALENGDWPELVAMSPERRRWMASPLFVQIGELRCAAAPLLAFTAPGGELRIIEGCGASHPEGEFAALLHKFHAFNVWRRPPERVRTFTLDLGSGRLTGHGDGLDVSAGLREITADCAEMTALIRSDGTVDEQDFACSDGAGCADCRFRSICRR